MGVLALLLALPAQALAQSPTNDQYDESSITVVDDGDGAPGEPFDPGDPGDPANASAGTLPFSGLDVAVLAATGSALVLFGIGMRRLTRRPDPT